jgi:hypothetical protein
MVVFVAAACLIGAAVVGGAGAAVGFMAGDKGSNKSTQKIDMKNFIENEINNSVTNSTTCDSSATARVMQTAEVVCEEVNVKIGGSGCGGDLDICGVEMKATAKASASCSADQTSQTALSNELANSIQNELAQQVEQTTSALPPFTSSGDNESETEVNIENRTSTSVSNKIDNILRSVASSQVSIRQDGTISMGNVTVECEVEPLPIPGVVDGALQGIASTIIKPVLAPPNPNDRWYDVGEPDLYTKDSEAGEDPMYKEGQQKKDENGKNLWLKEPGWKTNGIDGPRTPQQLEQAVKKHQGPTQNVSIGMARLTSVAESIAHAAASQIADTVVENKVSNAVANKVLQTTTQKAGDMTGLILLAAVVVIGVIGYFIVTKEDPEVDGGGRVLRRPSETK